MRLEKSKLTEYFVTGKQKNAYMGAITWTVCRVVVIHDHHPCLWTAQTAPLTSMFDRVFGRLDGCRRPHRQGGSRRWAKVPNDDISHNSGQFGAHTYSPNKQRKDDAPRRLYVRRRLHGPGTR